MAKRKPAIREMTKDQSRELVHHMIECMHLIPDMFLENLVEHL
jgi:hypothetical protein